MLTIRDIMQSEVVSVSPETSVRQLTRVLADAEISGCPVTDSAGRLVGVVSSTDVVRMAADEAEVHVASARVPGDPATLMPDPDEDEAVTDPYGFFLPEDTPFSGSALLNEFAESEFDSLTVADIMTPVTFSVRPDAGVKELSEFLVRGRIHRAVVVEDGELRGIVTSGDVLKAVADGRLS